MAWQSASAAKGMLLKCRNAQVVLKGYRIMNKQQVGRCGHVPFQARLSGGRMGGGGGECVHVMSIIVRLPGIHFLLQVVPY